MAYIGTTVVGSVGTTFTNIKHSLARASDGRLWCLYTVDSRYYYTKYSDDNGSSWSSASLVRDHGASGADGACIRMGLDDVPMVWCYGPAVNDADMYCYRWSGSSWTLQGTIDGATYWGSNEPNPRAAITACVTSYGRWYVAIGYGTTTQSYVKIVKSDDDGATWSNGGDPTAGGSGSATFRIVRNNHAIVIVCDSNDTLHVAFSDMNSGVTNDHSIFYRNADASASPATLTWENEKYFSTGNASANSMPYYVDLAIDSSGDVHLAWDSWVSGTDSTAIEAYFAKRTSGTWGSAIAVDSGDFSRPAVLFLQDDIPVIVGVGDPGAGHTGNSKLVKWVATDGTGATWTATTLDDTNSYYWLGRAAQYASGLEFTKLSSGLSFIAWDNTNTQFIYGADDPVWIVVSSPPVEETPVATITLFQNRNPFRVII